MNQMDLDQIGKLAKQASYEASQLSTQQKNAVLRAFANALERQTDVIMAANVKDLATQAVEQRFIDRLTITPARIQAMAAGLRALVQLTDPVGAIDTGWRTAMGLTVVQQRVPLGVIGMIYEARPNVTVDAAGLCFKAGNAVILRGGKEALNSNIALATILRAVLVEQHLNPNMVQIITDPAHELVQRFMKLTDYVDVLIPRGSARLIQTVVKHAQVPVIETGAGNCHIYVDQAAELKMATEIIVNGKTQRPSVCNATEKILIHQAVAKQYLPVIIQALRKHNVEVRGDELTRQIVGNVTPATDVDWTTEYNALIIAIKVVDSEGMAINHINRYGTHHSEVIVSDDYQAGRKFQQQVDAACVYVNASSRFTDGFEFGFGAEIGISTQKLHARGPMGLMALTSYKYVINGNGQIRP